MCQWWWLTGSGHFPTPSGTLTERRQFINIYKPLSVPASPVNCGWTGDFMQVRGHKRRQFGRTHKKSTKESHINATDWALIPINYEITRECLEGPSHVFQKVRLIAGEAQETNRNVWFGTKNGLLSWIILDHLFWLNGSTPNVLELSFKF